jgi:hypothetical protein
MEAAVAARRRTTVGRWLEARCIDGAGRLQHDEIRIAAQLQPVAFIARAAPGADRPGPVWRNWSRRSFNVTMDKRDNTSFILFECLFIF